MPYQNLKEFVNELERAGELKRIKAPVSPELEIAQITDRVSKARGPALLFENVKGHNVPLLINAFGSEKRMAMALGVDELDSIGREIDEIIHMPLPTSIVEKLKMIPKVAQFAKFPPKLIGHAPCQEVVIRSSRESPESTAEKTRPVILGTVPSATGRAESREGNNPKCSGDTIKSDHVPAATGDSPESTPSASSGRNSLDSPLRKFLSLFPIIKCWPQDGGKFITLPMVFTRSLSDGTRNCGMYRLHVYDERTTGMHWHIHHDGARHFREYKAAGKRMPVAVALGGDPAVTYAATAPMPAGVDEMLLAGFLRKKPVEMVKCKTIDMEVPAESEIVLEGYVDPEEERIEGPFGDHTGYYSLADMYPVFHIECITHRKEPIYPATIVGKPPMEDCYMGKATERIFLPLVRTQIPELVDMNLPLFGVFHNWMFLSIDKQYPYQAKKVMHSVWGLGQMMFTKIIVVVDKDVDVQNVDEVLWRVGNNVDPRRDITIVDGPLDVLDHSSPLARAGSKIGIDATKKGPDEGHMREWPDEIRMSDEIIQLVERRWKEYGF